MISKKYYSHLIANSGVNSWTVINTIIGKTKSPSKLALTVDNKILEDTKEIAKLFNNQFSTQRHISSPDSISINTFHYDGKSVKKSVHFQDVTYDEICKIIKELRDYLIVQLTEIINKIVSDSYYPECFKICYN